MITREQILTVAAKDPKYAEGIHAMEQKLGDMQVTPEALKELIRLFETAINHPDKYAMIREAAIKDGMADAEDLPVRADPVFLVSVLVALYGLQARLKSKGFAKGGLASAAAHLRAKGRNGDTILAHINPQEAALLNRVGGSGRLNPETGLPEFGFFSSLLKAIIPVAINLFAPGLGTAIGAAVGATATWAPIVGSAIIGGATSALTGGNFAEGALMGGLGAGVGSMIGEGVNSVAGTNLGQTAKDLVGGGLAGGAMSALTGKSVGEGMLTGAASAGLGSWVREQQGLSALGEKYGPDRSDMPEEAQTLDTLGAKYNSEPANKIDISPSDQVLNDLRSGDTQPLNLPGSNIVDPVSPAPDQLQPLASQQVTSQPVANVQAGAFDQSSNPASAANYRNQMDIASDAYKAPGKKFGLADAAKYMSVAQGLGSLLQAPPQAQTAVATLPPNVQAMFNQPAKVWDWDKIQEDATKSGMSLPQFMAVNQGSLNTYAKPAGSANLGIAPIAPPAPKQFARGGLGQIAEALAQGGGTGRSDSIAARLSDGEYVIDAETVALLGDGSTKAGAAKLDQMRAAIRKQKGRALAKGKISPDARNPMAYL